jgi:glycerol-3-phosphate dehydrogenase (NAD(P)+)
MTTVAVLGAGNMGTSVAQVIATNGHRVLLWSIEQDVLEEIRDHRLNTKYLDEVHLHERIEPAWHLAECVPGADLVVVAVPSGIVPRLGKDLAAHVSPKQAVLNVAKGLEADTHRRMSESLVAALGTSYADSVGSLAGPAIAIEMARGQPVAVIAGMPAEASAALVQGTLQNENLKVEITTDVAGMEYCAVLKNIYAIALGIADGMRLGMNTKAFLATIATQEMARIVEVLGGRPETVYGLAGLGDVITTGFSPHSRNRTLGEHMGAAGDWRHFLRTNTVEGVPACRAMKEILPGRGVATPLMDAVHDAITEAAAPPERLRRFIREFSY